MTLTVDNIGQDIGQPVFKIHASTARLYAERNGELHVLCRTLLDKYREVAPDDPFVYEADSILCNVPNIRYEK